MTARYAYFFCLISFFCPAAEITRASYLQQAHEDGITIVWRTDKALENPSISIRLEGAGERQMFPADTILKRENLSGVAPGTIQYEVTLVGLQPETKYRYWISAGGTDLKNQGPEQHFTTYPPVGKPTPARIWVVGDSGTGEDHQRRVHQAMLTYTKEGKRPIDLYLHVGDMAYGEGTNEQFQKRFFEPYQETLSHTVCWASKPCINAS